MPAKLRPIAVALALFGSPLLAAELNLSHEGPVPQLIELYTSEGCSSCPPADTWLGRLQDDPGLWRERIPLAFHVDYWNYLGWRDRYSQADFSKRQRKIGAREGMRTIYTPGFMIDGHEWRGFFRRADLPDNTRPSGGRLTLEYRDDGVTLTLDSPRRGQLTGHLVLLGFDLKSEIESGENSGRVLEHQFVVLQHQQRQASDRHWQFETPKTRPGRRYAIAAWVSDDAFGSALQALGGWLPN